MTAPHGDAYPRSSHDPVIDWLLDADPSIRWQLMRDLIDAPAAIVAAERARVAAEGWGRRLLGEQLADGGWNCEAERGSVRSSFHTTICVLEGLLAFEQAFGARTPVTDARRRAQEYLLERRLLRRLSTGEIIDPTWTRFAFPPLWHYDVLRALDYLRTAGVRPDARVEEAASIVFERRQDEGPWLLDVRHRDTLYEELSGTVGAPNRWITLRALRVLEWYRGRD